MLPPDRVATGRSAGSDVEAIDQVEGVLVDAVLVDAPATPEVVEMLRTRL